MFAMSYVGMFADDVFSRERVMGFGNDDYISRLNGRFLSCFLTICVSNLDFTHIST